MSRTDFPFYDTAAIDAALAADTVVGPEFVDDETPIDEGDPGVDMGTGEAQADPNQTDPYEPPTSSDAEAPQSSEGQMAASGLYLETTFATKGDRIRFKTNDMLSAHGWWIALVPKATAWKAKTTIDIQFKSRKTGWTTVERGFRIAGPGTAKRASAREVCSDKRFAYYWRTVVDVDIIGMVDTAEKYYSPRVKLFCLP